MNGLAVIPLNSQGVSASVMQPTLQSMPGTGVQGLRQTETATIGSILNVSPAYHIAFYSSSHFLVFEDHHVSLWFAKGNPTKVATILL